MSINITLYINNPQKEGMIIDLVHTLHLEKNKDDKIIHAKDKIQNIVYVVFDHQATYEEFVDLLTQHVYNMQFEKPPTDSLTDLGPDDLDIEISHNNQDYGTVMLMQRQLDRARQDTQILDLVVSQLSDDNQALEERLNNIEQFVSYSGVLHYHSFFSSLITELNEKGLIDPENLDTGIVEKVH